MLFFGETRAGRILGPRFRWLIITAAAVCALAHGSPCHAVTVDFWHPWPGMAQTIRTLAATYSKSSGVTIRVRSFSPNSYHPWTAKQTPDLVGLYLPNKLEIRTLAEAGRVEDIGLQMSRNWYALFWPGMLETFTIRSAGKSAVYGVPLTGQVHMFVYSKSLFRAARIGAPPVTWAALMSAGQKLRAIGVKPYAGGFGSDMPPLAAVYEYGYLGAFGLSQTYAGNYPYTSPLWVSDLSLYSEMRQYGFTDLSSAKLSDAAAIKALIDGRVGIVFVDTSFETIRSAYRPRFNDWGIFAPPIDTRARFLPRLPGRVVEGLVINKRSPRIAQAIAFARWLTEYRQQIILANDSRSIPATTSAGLSATLRPVLRAFASVGMRDQSIDLRVFESKQVLATYYSGVRSILGGSSTPSSVARRTQAVKGR